MDLNNVMHDHKDEICHRGWMHYLRPSGMGKKVSNKVKNALQRKPPLLGNLTTHGVHVALFVDTTAFWSLGMADHGLKTFSSGEDG